VKEVKLLSLISKEDQDEIRRIFTERLREEVNVIIFTQEFECDYCKESRMLLTELAQLSNGKVKVQVYDFVKDNTKAQEFKINKIPATLIMGDKLYGIRYFGIPSGYEFSSLIDDIIDVSNRATRLSNSTKEKLKQINKPVNIQVFVTPTCPYCPRAVRLAHQFAMESQFIEADMIESIEFPQLANKYEVMAVPKIVINDSISFEGALPEPQFLDQVLLALEERERT
jgi:glutaredoxin-like protein